MLDALGCKIARVPKMSVVDGINATKLELPRMWFNKATTGDGIEALRHSLRREVEDLRGYAAPRLDNGYSRRGPGHGDCREAHRAQSTTKVSELPPGIPLPGLTMDQFMDIEDSWSKRQDRV